MANDSALVVSCPHCNTSYKIPAVHIGKRLTCRSCSKPFEATRKPAAPAHPTIIRLALKCGYLSEADVDTAYAALESELQTGRKATIEDVMVEQGIVSASRMALLKATRRFCRLKREDERFGNLAVKAGWVPREEVERALKDQAEEFKQSRVGRLLGDILVERSQLTAGQRDQILAAQNRIEADTEEEACALIPEDDGAGDAPGDAPEEMNGQAPEDALGEEGPGSPVEAVDTAEAKEAEPAAPVEDLFEITLSDDMVEAYIAPLNAVPESVTVADIKALLKSSGISFGIVEESQIEGFLRYKGVHAKPFCIAKGQAAVPGRDAEVTFHFNTESIVGQVQETGEIDFRDRGEIPQVKAGELMAEKTPMVKGEPGMTVKGRRIEVLRVADRRLVAGPGVELSSDRLQAFAKIAGQPKMTGAGKMSVAAEMKIPGDIDLHTGHVRFDGDIFVSGTVRDGFQVSGSSLFAKEIQDADVTATGDVVVSGGVFGGTIRAEGSVKAKFFLNAKIYAYGDVEAKTEVIDSEIYTSGALNIPAGKLITSAVSAKMGVTAKDVGTEMSGPCRIKVGVDEHVQSVTAGFDAEIAKCREALEGFRETGEELQERDREVQKRIAEKAQIQDRSMVVRRDIEAKIAAGEVARDKVGQAESMMAELEAKAGDAENDLQQLFVEQDAIADNLVELAAAEKEAKDRIVSLKEEKEAVVEWAEKQGSAPFVKAIGTVFQGTRVTGPNAHMVVERDSGHVRIREVRSSEPDMEATYHMVVTALSR